VAEVDDVAMIEKPIAVLDIWRRTNWDGNESSGKPSFVRANTNNNALWGVFLFHNGINWTSYFPHYIKLKGLKFEDGKSIEDMMQALDNYLIENGHYLCGSTEEFQKLSMLQ
jgi:hypothetical protein